jgi:hypothetical protein
MRIRRPAGPATVLSTPNGFGRSPNLTLVGDVAAGEGLSMGGQVLEIPEPAGR